MNYVSGHIDLNYRELGKVFLAEDFDQAIEHVEHIMRLLGIRHYSFDELWQIFDITCEVEIGDDLFFVSRVDQS